MATLAMFAIAREAAGVGVDTFDAATVGELLEQACDRYGERFGHVLGASRVWVNGEEMFSRELKLRPSDEVAVIPPIAGG